MANINDYNELRHLGSGGFGDVWLVSCKQDGRQVCIATLL